jgi:hypothetical protein
MVGEEFAALPEQPASVADWEDLLVRLEIVPRVVRNAVEEVENSASAVEVLTLAADREVEVGRWLEAAARIGEPGERAADAAAADVAELALRFASLRARTFAMLQRRGVDVWRWQGPLRGGGSATVNQLLLWLAGRDAVLLSELRRSARSDPAGC